MIPRIAAIILITLFLSTLINGRPWAAPSSKRHALLIGINSYSSKDLRDLRGAVNDVRLLSRVLMTNYGFSGQDITVLEDGDAGRSRILKELKELADRAGPDDVVYIHFSGHGSQVDDLDGDEKDDGKDETLVPHDGRTPGVPDVTDDELKYILAGIKSRSAIIVFDSCHSGTATRGGPQVLPRFVPEDKRTDLYKDLVPERTRAIVPLIGERHVLLTAAAAHELALDAPVDGTPYGLFSYALAQSLQASGTGANAISVFENIERELQRIKGQLALYDMPEAQLEAPPERLNSVLIPSPGPEGTNSSAAPGTARVTWVEVQPVKKENGVILRKSVSMGAVPGSIWAIYPPGEQDFHSGQAIATVTVTEQRGSGAFAKLETPGVSIESGSRAVLLFGPLPSSRIPVRWISGTSEDRKELEKAISDISDEVHFVGENDFARFNLEVSGNQCKVYGADGVTLVAEISAESRRGLASGLVPVFSRSLTVSELMALNNPVSDIKLKIMVAKGAQRSIQRLSGRGVRIVSEGAGVQRFSIRRSGDPRTAENSLQLQIEASEDCYLTLVDVDSQGKVTVVFPNQISEKENFYKGGFISRGNTVLIPDSLEPENRAGYYVDFAPPAGMDTIRGFCSTDRETADELRRSINVISSRSGGERSASTRSLRGTLRHVLTDTLRQDFTRSAFRGVEIVPDESEATSTDITAAVSKPRRDWVATSLSIHVKE